MEELSIPIPGKDGQRIESFKNPIHVAAIRGDVETIEGLSKSDADVNQEENGQTPLHLAVISGETPAVRKLISLGANLSKRNKDGYIPLHLAVLCNRISIIVNLINKDEEGIDIFDGNGNTALHTAVLNDNDNAVRILLDKGAKADLPNKEEKAPLHLAVMKGNLEVIDVLRKYVSIQKSLYKNKFYPIHLAVLCNQIGAIRKIGKIINKIDVFNEDGDSALHLATKLRNLEAMKALLDLKANVNLKNTRGFAPIHLAVIYHNLSANEILERVDIDKLFRKPPIYVSEAQRNIPALKLLRCPIIDVNIINKSGSTALNSLIMTDCEEEIKMLLDLGAKFNHRDLIGVTPLHQAVCYGNKKTIEMLLHYEADIRRTDNMGDMPIHTAARFCSLVGIETLIKHSENNISFRNENNNLTPRDIIMMRVREDTFRTAVQSVTELLENCYLKRRIPLDSNEVLKSAKLILKLEIWKNSEDSTLNNPEYLFKIIPIIRNYINDCFAEVRQMKSTFLYENNLSLYDFAIQGLGNIPAAREEVADAVLNHILNIPVTKGYPIYRDKIVTNLERSSFLKRVPWYISVIHNKKSFLLNLYEVVKYLGNEDILSLLFAFPNKDIEPMPPNPQMS